MREETIAFKEVMQRLWSGEEADIEVDTYSASRNTGGDIVTYQKVKLNINQPLKSSQNQPTEGEYLTAYKPYINIVMQSGDLKKIYKVGLRRFNGKKILI